MAPEIVLLGDSQISFGAGEVMEAFFSDLPKQCAMHLSMGQAEALKGLDLGVLGVRQTSLGAWTATGGKRKWYVCGKDPTWGVNTSTFGVLRSEKRGKYEQIGETPGTRFCEAGLSPLQAMFREGYYAPRLFVMWFLGNDAGRWSGADGAETAAADVAALAAQIPAETPCVFMTTQPSYRGRENTRRAAAQKAVLDAFAASGARCQTVAGVTAETRAAMEGSAGFYRRHEDGRVKDPFHPLKPGAQRWLSLRKEAICAAVAAALPEENVANAVAHAGPPAPEAWQDPAEPSALREDLR